MTDSAPLSGTGLPPGHAALSVPADAPSTAPESDADVRAHTRSPERRRCSSRAST